MQSSEVGQGQGFRYRCPLFLAQEEKLLLLHSHFSLFSIRHPPFAIACSLLHCLCLCHFLCQCSTCHRGRIQSCIQSYVQSCMAKLYLGRKDTKERKESWLKVTQRLTNDQVTLTQLLSLLWVLSFLLSSPLVTHMIQVISNSLSSLPPFLLFSLVIVRLLCYCIPHSLFLPYSLILSLPACSVVVFFFLLSFLLSFLLAFTHGKIESRRLCLSARTQALSDL